MSIITRFWNPIDPAPPSPSAATIALSRTLRDEVVRYYQAGNLEDALNTARQLLELQRQELGESHPDFKAGLRNVETLQRLRDAEIETRLAAAQTAPPPPASEPVVPPPNTPELAVFDQVLALDYVGVGDPAGLADAKRLARQAREQAALGGPASETLVEGCRSLVTMVGKGSSLGTDEWIAAHDAIVRNFGRPLAKAAASEKLVLVK